MIETIQKIAASVNAKNISSGFVKDLAIIQAVKQAGIDPISLVGSDTIKAVTALVR